MCLSFRSIGSTFALFIVAFWLALFSPHTAQASGVPVKINFQSSSATTPNGYLADKGQSYADRGNGYRYGWNSDHTDVSRERDVHTDQRLDTLIHFHQGGRWELKLNNGTYDVYVVIGDASYGDTTHTLNVEGVNFWNNQALGANEFAARQRTVTVNDGKLTLDSGNAADRQTKIALIQVLPQNSTVSDPMPPNAPVCNPEAHLSGVIQSDNRTGRITNTSSSCSYQVGMAAYRKFDETIDNQEIFHSTTATIAPNQSINVQVNLPSCATQVDLFYGEVLPSLNGVRYGDRLLAAKHINGTNYCQPLPGGNCPQGQLNAIEGVSAGQNVSGILNIGARVTGPTSRVVFTLSGASGGTHTENVAPYYYLGDTNNSPNGWNTATAPSGNYTMTVTRYGTYGMNLVVPCDTLSVNFCINCAPPVDVRPILECVSSNQDGSFTAHFGYQNNSSGTATIAVGSNNQFSPAPANRNQPTTFNVGRNGYWMQNATTVNFSGADLTWTLNGVSVTATANSAPCAYRVFIDKQWVDLRGMPISRPDNLPLGWNITVTSPLGSAVCSYPNNSLTLVCTYTNNAPANDNNGLWATAGSSYTVTENGNPVEITPVSGIGTFNSSDGTCVFGRDGINRNCTVTVVNRVSRALPPRP